LPPRVGWGKWKFGGIFNIGKNISILAKVTQVSDVAHGPIVLYISMISSLKSNVSPAVGSNNNEGFQNSIKYQKLRTDGT
jgi:hypothetical protein